MRMFVASCLDDQEGKFETLQIARHFDTQPHIGVDKSIDRCLNLGSGNLPSDIMLMVSRACQRNFAAAPVYHLPCKQSR